MDRIDRRVWYAVPAVVVLLLLGWFGGVENPGTDEGLRERTGPRPRSQKVAGST